MIKTDFKSDRTQKKIFIVLTILMAIIFFIFNYLTPYLADDYSYMYSFAESNQRIENLGDIFTSISAHFQTMNGRSIPHAFVQLFLIPNKMIFNVVNACMGVGLVYLIYKHANLNKKTNNLLYILVFFGVMYFVPKLGQVMFWLDGSCNYLWGMVFILAILLFYRIQFLHPTLVFSKLSIGFIMVLSILAGGMSENSSAAGIFIMVGVVFFMLLEKVKVPKWMYISTVLSFVSWLIMIVSPGNFVRLTNINDQTSFLQSVFIRSYKSLDYMKDFQSILIVSFFIMMILAFKKLNRKRLIAAILFFVAAILANFAMVAIPFYPERAFFGSMIFMIVANASLASELLEDTKLNVIVKIGAVLLIYYASIDLAYGIQDVKKCSNVFAARERLIYSEIKKGNLNITAPACIANTKYFALNGLDEIKKNPKHWVNESIARYYGIESIVRK